MSLTLLIPELLWPEPQDDRAFDGLSCPSLSTLLARSRFLREPSQAFESCLAGLCGHFGTSGLAALRRLGEIAPAADEEPPSGTWICADPVHLHFRQERLILADASRLNISPEEAGQLAATLNEHLADTGNLVVATADRWYLRMAGNVASELATIPPLSAVAGRSVETIQPESRELRRLLNEVQMLLHAHPVNCRREENGKMTINSLWLWGAGNQPEKTENPFDTICSNSPLARGLARAAAIPASPVPAEATALLQAKGNNTNSLVVIEDLLASAQYQDADAWRTALNELETRWFAPLRSALFSGRIRQLRIAAPTAYGSLFWTIQRHDLCKLWRKPQAPEALVKSLTGS